MRIAACALLVVAFGHLSPIASSRAFAAEPINIGERRELFVDDFLIEKSNHLEFRLQSSVPREIVLTHDAPWEGSGCGFYTIFRDGDIIRMYYKAWALTNEDGSVLSKRPVAIAYAESKDGIHWVKPDLGLFEFEGSKKNNIIWMGHRLNDFTVFKDTNPACRPGERYKAVGHVRPGDGKKPELGAFKSDDAIHWSPLGDKSIITKGAFDTQNVAFWDPLRKQYFCYIRHSHGGPEKIFQGIRDIRVSTSPDFLTWTEPVLLTYGDAPDEPLYTNQIQPYYRAPHLFVGFPTRYVQRPVSPGVMALPDPEHRQNRMKFDKRFGTAVTDGLFMTSRDGKAFHRWDEAFLRAGPERKHNWLYGDCYPTLGLMETPAEHPDAAPELSFYVGEDYWKHGVRLRRHTLRVDGFVALHAKRTPGEFVMKPLVFSGKKLSLNFATSAAGNLRIELQDEAGKPIEGYTLADCDEVFGDTIDRKITWKENADVSKLAGKPIRLRMVLKEADLYSMKFGE